MVPAAFLWLDAFPMTSNGKIDRKALPTGAGDLRSPGSDFVAPAGALEIQLTMIFENLLGVKPIGTHDNFFDLGGHSLLAVRLLAEIEKACGKALPLASLFQAQTVAELALLIQKDYDPSAWSTITPIQPTGSRYPFFCVSRPNVNSLGYVALARHLGRDQPVYGLQSTFREEVEGPYEPAEYATLADRYIQAMRRVQPEGPYFIGGMCEGAHIAFEMVRRLEAEGHRIGMFAIFDAWAVEHTRVYALWRFNTYRSRAYHRAWQLGQLGKAVPRALFGKKAPAEPEQPAPAAKPAPAPSAPLPSPVATEAAPTEDAPIGMPEPELAAPPAVMVRTHERFKQRYFPEDYTPTVLLSPITVFRIREQEYYRIHDPQCGWGKRSAQAVEVHLCTGTHKHFLREPFVRDVALKLNACLLRAGIDRER
jgi:thioesterase domain-containing protein/acyl carrier protein